MLSRPAAPSRLMRTVLLLSLFVTTAFAQNENSGPRPKKKYLPLPNIPAQAFQAHDEWFRGVSKKIEDGTANTQERRAWYEMKKRYYPFTPDSRPPRNWRANAVAQGDRLDPKLNASSKTIRPQAVTDYTWTPLGGNVNWAQGQPPSAGSPDNGSGRATAIWVNPNDKRDVLIGHADGGLWKSTNVSTTENAATWVPLTDFQPSLSVGSVVARVSATDGNRLGPNSTIWVATGEGNFSIGDVQGVGILKSTDGGATWQLKQVPWVVAGDGTSMFDRTSIRRIALDPRNANNMWLAADSGVFRSTDAGETWSLVTGLPYFKKNAGDCWYVHYMDLIVDDQTPAVGQPSTIYAAAGRTGNAACSTISRVDSGIYRSTDGGATWVNISTPNANCPGVVAGTSSRGYSCVGSGFAATGLTNATTVNGNVGRITLVHGAGNKKKVYALLQSIAAGAPSLGIYVTSDASAASVTWTAATNSNYCNGQCWYDMTGAVNPTNDAAIYIGGIDGYWSTNSGTAWFNTTSWTGWGTANYAHADHHHAVWVDATTLYLVTDGGFHVGTVPAGAATLNGIQFVNQNTGMMTMQVYGMGQSAQQANRIHVGTQDNGQPKVVLDASNNITRWYEIAGGDGGFSATDRTSDAIAYEEYVYAEIARATNATYTGTAAWNWTTIRNFGGCTTTGGCNPDNSTQFIAPFTLDYNNQARLYSGSRKVYRWNGGTTWVSYSPDLTTTNNANSVTWIHSAKNNGVGGTLWAGTENGRVWMTTNATSDTADSATWVDVTKAPLPNRSVSFIDTDPTDGQKAIVVYNGFNTGHVFRTLDGGTTWTDISGQLPNEPFMSIAVDPTTPSRVFVGSDFGVYVNEDGWNGTSWIRINNGALPYQKVNHLDFSPAAGGKLRAGTHGRGVWELTIAPNAGCGGSVPAAPTGVTLTPNNNQVTISWTAVSGAASYRVYRATGSTCPAISGGTAIGSGIAGTSFTDTTALNGTNYVYFVTAVNASSCEGAQSACATAQPAACTPPTAPTLTSANADCNGVNLAWTAGTGTTLSYNVYRADGSCPAGPLTKIAGPISGLSYSDTTAVAGTTYSYIIRGSCEAAGGVESPNSNCLSAARTSAPAVPTGLAATGNCPTGVDLTWNASAGAISYNILRGTSCGALSSIATGVTTTSYTDSTAAAGTGYFYAVQATGTCGTSASSSCVGPTSPASDTFRLQVESAFVSGYKDLSTTEFEASAQQASTANITAAGEYQIGGATPLKWISPAYAQATDLGSAPWTFDVYGITNGTGAAGQLFARVYRYNGGSPVLLFTTGYANPNISTATSQTRFTWTHSPGIGTNVPAGDRMYVEIWVNATAGGSGATTNDVANAEVTNVGAITAGNFASTQSCNATFETIEESNNGSGRNLDHVWTIPLSGTGTVVRTFNLVARVGGTQNVAFEYGTAIGGPWTAITTINNAAFPSCATPTTFSLPTNLSGNLFIRARRTTDNGTRDMLDVDYLAVASVVPSSTSFTLNYDHSSADSLVRSGKCLACTPTDPPSNVTATATSENQITVNWGAIAGATTYRVYRSNGACPGGTFTLLASGIATTSYVDNTAAAPNAYSYKVTAMDSTGSCESSRSACASAVAYMTCLTAPSFNGIISATASAATACTIDLDWDPATSPCGNGLTYSVYRGTSSGFTADATTRIQTGITATAYSDSAALLPGTAYFYIVRATDSGNGVEEGNTVEDSDSTVLGCTAAPLQVQVFSVRSVGGAVGENVLQWVNPALGNAGSTITINYRTDQYPTSPTDGTVILTNRAVTFGAADSFTHSNLTNGTTYYYAVWVKY